MPPAAASLPRTIEEVLARLDEIIDRAKQERSRTGLFACLYRGVTRRVRDGIATGRFEDGARMERFDVLFANRYLLALEAYETGRGHLPRSWAAAFEAGRAGHLLILQHLLLGMNAHIHLDLGASAAETAPGASLRAMKHDFYEINRLLGEMLDEVQARIATVSPWIGWLDRLGCRTDEAVCTFCLEGARDVAWQAALRFSTLPPAQVETELHLLDRLTAVKALPIRNPGFFLAPALRCIQVREPRDVVEAIRALE